MRAYYARARAATSIGPPGLIAAGLLRHGVADPAELSLPLSLSLSLSAHDRFFIRRMSPRT